MWKHLEQRNFRGAERYYNENGGVVHRLARFGPTELRDAYERYRQDRHLKTEWVDLNEQQVDLISFP